MKTNTVDVYIYVTSKGLRDIASIVVEQLTSVVGVAGVSINKRIKDLLAIKYDPESVTAIKLLNVLKENGHSAFLVGM